MLVVDAANVIGSRPTGWWRDRAGAARAFVDRLVAAADAGLLEPRVLVVLEGAARAATPAGPYGPVVEVVHAARSGDDAVVAAVRQVRQVRRVRPVRVVTADRALRERVARLGAEVVGPAWLWSALDG